MEINLQSLLMVDNYDANSRKNKKVKASNPPPVHHSESQYKSSLETSQYQINEPMPDVKAQEKKKKIAALESQMSKQSRTKKDKSKKSVLLDDFES